jgi:hypothetical protein
MHRSFFIPFGGREPPPFLRFFLRADERRRRLKSINAGRGDEIEIGFAPRGI